MSLTAWYKSVPQETRPGQVPPSFSQPEPPEPVGLAGLHSGFRAFFYDTAPDCPIKLIRYSPQAVSLSHSNVSKPSHYFSLADFEQACATREN